MKNITTESLQKDINTVSMSMQILRELFAQTEDTDVAKTIIALMDTKDNLIQIQTMLSDRELLEEPVIDLGNH